MTNPRAESERSKPRPFLAKRVGIFDHRDREEIARPRPFVLTSGRVASDGTRIGLETQVSSREWGDFHAVLPPEKRAIVGMCAQPLSVAEISARLHMHFGVARVLVGDLAAAGFLDVRSEDRVDPHDPELIMRVIRGLRELK